MAGYEVAELIDDGDAVQIRLALGVAPGEEAVAAEENAVGLRVLADGAVQHHAEFKAGPLPGEPDDVVVVALVEFSELRLSIRAGGKGDGPIGVQVIDVSEGQKRVQRRVDGCRRLAVGERARGIEGD